MNFDSLFVIVIGTIFINNYVLSRFLGLCPFLGVSRKLSSAFGMGMAVIFVMTLASFVTWTIYEWVLVPYGITYLRTIVFILVIASLVQFVETVLNKTAPALYQALGIFLPLISTNCAILGVSVLNIDEQRNLIEALVQGFSGGVGFTLALLLMAGIRERLELARVPAVFRGVPIALICAGLMSIAFLGFAGFSIH
ncbi:MAG: electron transport complex subunit RsxA [Candidatus Glassbacteria bacterium RIFCSPLOWO2_12_FULL_58_11]|uniref:Ion-translocating oxidoreductase complex subunit A n=2 Tax=Candidatus Glassiibacteriota TaxID=1817805 RepID=A0A1F5YX08_9BACT|nr:MAG: electron transport complex subunit RsxA [Candidatus Glassbacteria bacterium GWA2_58_10]OGG04442.1 MAG: electron transport complex subunit RsxA [Candidatus Glassbacteria bacterium RIFCSPLOWO2_12_FULL_58_11]